MNNLYNKWSKRGQAWSNSFADVAIFDTGDRKATKSVESLASQPPASASPSVEPPIITMEQQYQFLKTPQQQQQQQQQHQQQQQQQRQPIFQRELRSRSISLSATASLNPPSSQNNNNSNAYQKHHPELTPLLKRALQHRAELHARPQPVPVYRMVLGRAIACVYMFDPVPLRVCLSTSLYLFLFLHVNLYIIPDITADSLTQCAVPHHLSIERHPAQSDPVACGSDLPSLLAGVSDGGGADAFRTILRHSPPKISVHAPIL